MRSLGLFLLTLVVTALTAETLEAQWVPTNGPFIGPFYVPRTYSLVSCVGEGGATLLFAGTQSGLVFRTTDYGNNWTRTDGRGPASMDTGFTSRDILALALGGRYLYAGTGYYNSSTRGAGIFRSVVGDTHWIGVNTGLTNLTVNSIISCRSASGDTLVFAGTWGGGIFRSTILDTVWTQVNIGLTNLVVTALASNPNGQGGLFLYAGTWVEGVFRSTDNGSNWTEASSGLVYRSISALAVKGAGVFAGTATGGVFRSTDDGTTWTEANTGLPPNARITALTVHDTLLFASLFDMEVYCSRDDGAHWIRGSTGLPLCGGARSLSVSDTNLFTGIGGCEPSVWRRPLSQMQTGIEGGDEHTPSKFSLEQNYPNPFNPVTTVMYALPVDTHMHLKVCDILGRKVISLLDENMSAGFHQSTFDATNLSSGVYFYRMEAGNFTSVKKLVLLK